MLAASAWGPVLLLLFGVCILAWAFLASKSEKQVVSECATDQYLKKNKGHFERIFGKMRIEAFRKQGEYGTRKFIKP